MPENRFPIGSVVILKSGGPEMTITSYHQNVPVCTYFDKGQLQTLKTFKDNLKLVQQDQNDSIEK